MCAISPEFPQIEIFVKDSNNLKLPIDRKGTGIQQLLIILAYLNETNAKIMGIEEIEINLSPHSQKKILEILFGLIDKSDYPLEQVFITTHSRIVASKQKGIQFLMIKKSEDGCSEVDSILDDDDRTVAEFFQQ